MATTSTTRDKPTIVLVHGAFAESSSWNGVIDGLLAAGFPVIAAANPLRGVKNDSDYLARVLEGIEGPLVLVGRYEGGTLGETLVAFDLPDGDKDLSIIQDRSRAQFAADVSEGESARMGVTQRPIAESALDEPSAAAAWHSLPSWFLFGELDKNIPVAVHRFMADRAGSRRTVEVPGGSHSVGIPEAAQVVALIREAALATSDTMASAS